MKQILVIITHVQGQTCKKHRPHTAYAYCFNINILIVFCRDAFTIFSGGMPRASYGDRHTVSVQQGPKHTVFDFTSKVVDFVVLSDGDGKDLGNN